MKRTPNYYDGYAGLNPTSGPIGDTVYAAGPTGYGGYEAEQQLPQHPHQPHHQQQHPQPYGLGNNDIGSPTKRKADHTIYREQDMRLGTPAAEEADGDYEYDMNTYGASRSRNDGGLSAGEYGDMSDLATVRPQNRSGKDVRMVINNHSNINVPLDQSAGSSVTSNEYAPPTPSGDAATYEGYSIGGAAGSVESPPDDQKGAGSINSNPNSNTASSPTDLSRKKQKRNKPTLSCSEETSRTAAAAGGRRVTRPLLSKKVPGSFSSLSIPNIADRGILNAHVESLGSVALSTGLLSNVPYSVPSASNVFGIGSEHPFANYWTCEGGLPEVISVLPDKIQSDILLVRYFECFDPVYPMIDRHYFYTEFENFWALAPEDKNMVDPAFIGLLFAMLALGTQFVSSTTPKERKQTAEFYASASNQALRLSSYLSAASVRSIQAMVLITYFLINDNHASDGWAFAGILMRQAYAMGLHRDPNIVVPNASPYEKQRRRKVWQAVLLQDTFMTVLMSLPPTATHTDVNVEDLEEEDDIGSNNQNSVTDTAYIRGSWTLANLVQEVISSPRSLDVPICTTSRHKSKMVSDFRAIYRSFPDIFRSWDPESVTQLAKTNKRVVRQTLFLSSNYFHNLMLVHASESADVPVNVRGTLEAAHDAITSFFVLFKLFENEAGVWWVFNHRAFLEALCIGGVLKETVFKNSGDPVATAKDPLYARARADIEKMVEIMRIMGEGEQGSEVARTRVKVLSEFL
ncbi:zn 2cys6 transcription factor [Sporothrix schenckii 1099-18]|uniref:Zn 2cys6 transcription factor n=1 Tax=Sporothrix schenckii 1099-18 TaxID=1397361 RepID=A0A0F2MDG8_SPOSC|nr:zn 2cys6 transcription factor [Sporothrix schenckii 1099-18]KJR87129.1 zn 2cys6 transcription factor [Sporothrix schenckii 1099-18]